MSNVSNDKTGVFNVKSVKEKLISDMLKEVNDALKERGYNPINQIVGYLISGDPGYISNYKDCREKITKFDKTEIMAIVLEKYIKDIK